MIANDIIIVSGLPRSGTSMMMKILETGGIKPLTDNIRESDRDNPKGYYELEKVKQLKKDSSWIDDAMGKTLKVISMLLYDLPKDRNYQVIFMLRKINEILASQKKMLKNRDEKDNTNNTEMTKLYKNHLKDIKKWLESNKNFNVLYIWYHELINNPKENIKKIDTFLEKDLNISAMIKVIDPKLYRNKS